MNAYVSFMNAITANEEMKHSTQACNTKVPLKNQTMLRTVKNTVAPIHLHIRQHIYEKNET